MVKRYILGGVIAGSGGLTVGGSAATDAVLSRNRKKKADEFIKKYNTKLDEVKNNYLEIHVELQERADLSKLGSRVEENSPIGFNFGGIWLRELARQAGVQVGVLFIQPSNHRFNLQRPLMMQQLLD